VIAVSGARARGRRDHEHARRAGRRRREVARVGELAAEVQRRDEAEHLADRRAAVAQPLRELERRAAREQLIAALARAARGRQQEHAVRHACRIPRVELPVNPPVLPMLAKRVAALPDGGDWIFEPKWDGFRVLVFRDGDELLLQSRDAKPLDRYFPELRAPLCAQLPARCALDGELVIARTAARLRGAPAAHPPAGVARRAPRASCPRRSCSGTSVRGRPRLRGEPFASARGALERVLASASRRCTSRRSPRDRAIAADWFERFEGAGLDGVMAKPASGAYQPNKRVMLKVKHERECDCVVAGFRWHKGGAGERVGSLLLGLYDDEGALHHVGVAASFSDAKRRELVDVLAPYRERALDDHPWKAWGGAEAENGQRMPGGKSRWSGGKDLSWEPLRPELVVEVAYDHMEGTRFRHTAHFRRWRRDKDPRECTYAQLDVVSPEEIVKLFG
jgi:ATP-dependent DNA ligase